MNGLLCINKPPMMTSFDVVRRVQKQLGVKAGHSGTLDPNATGVLVVAVNKATKALPYLDLRNKIYTAEMIFGKKTDTGDIWGEVLDEKQIPSYNEEVILQTLNTFIGKQRQRVPMVSAKKVNGKKLYEYHRENIEIETQYTDIEIYKIEFLGFVENGIRFKAHVSNGTYIRTLCEDIGEALDSYATMSALERTQVGSFSIENTINLEDLTPDVALLNVKEALTLPRIVDEKYDQDIEFGLPLILDTEADMLLVDGGKHYAIYKRSQEKLFKVVRGLW